MRLLKRLGLRVQVNPHLNKVPPSFHKIHANRRRAGDTSDSEDSDPQSEEDHVDREEVEYPVKTLEREEGQVDEENESERKRKLGVLYDVLQEQPHLLSSELKEALSD